ncbi:DUF6998 domain-containing protein [Rhodopseudomonas palustris]|uniref:DUF6998 domain-containing protein n=1 Tax=Rhodopseudomonas palustris TaxID=1076 RepID=UPI0009BAE28C|nr:hypothetical protein [Rhodopseudomonas palustris]
MIDSTSRSRIKEILATVKPLAAEYYQLTGKPLGVTGEVAEYIAAEILGLTLVEARMAGHDAILKTPAGEVRIQIKGRVFDKTQKRSQRIGSIKPGAHCDKVILVLLDNKTLEPVEMWEASYKEVVAHLEAPGSRARNQRGSMSVNAFKRLGERVWFSCSNLNYPPSAPQ